MHGRADYCDVDRPLSRTAYRVDPDCRLKPDYSCKDGLIPAPNRWGAGLVHSNSKHSEVGIPAACVPPLTPRPPVPGYVTTIPFDLPLREPG